MSNSFATPWTVAQRGPPPMRFPRQECQSGFPFPSAGNLYDPGIEARSPAPASEFFATEPPGKPGR